MTDPILIVSILAGLCIVAAWIHPVTRPYVRAWAGYALALLVGAGAASLTRKTRPKATDPTPTPPPAPVRTEAPRVEHRRQRASRIADEARREAEQVRAAGVEPTEAELQALRDRIAVARAARRKE